MCRNGRYTERGIKEIDGFMSERWRIEPEYAIKVDSSLGLLAVLLEPTSIVAKAWEQIVAVGQRAFWEPRTVLVTGAGPIGLLAALLGKQRGLDVHVLDRAESGPKPALVRALARATTRAALLPWGSSQTSSSSAPVSGQSLPTAFSPSPRTGSCASPGSGAVANHPVSPQQTLRRA